MTVRSCFYSLDIDEKCVIWTYSFGKSTNPPLVLIHGYQASSLMFYKLFGHLKDHFHVYCIDLIGMGRSSRPEFQCKTFEEIDLYYVKAVEAWRAAVGLKKFAIAGHTFGGYVAARYALHYPKNISNLVMLSPFGSDKNDMDSLNLCLENPGF